MVNRKYIFKLLQGAYVFHGLTEWPLVEVCVGYPEPVYAFVELTNSWWSREPETSYWGKKLPVPKEVEVLLTLVK